MRLRNVAALLAAVLLATLLVMVPAQAKPATPCPPCAVAGSVVGSVIRPPYDMVIHGTIFDTFSQQSYFFKVEGPYNFIGGTLGRGTVKIVGPGAPKDLRVNVAFDGASLADFTMRTAPGASGFAEGHFTYDGSQLVGDHVTVSSQTFSTGT